jgi:hypothetical protein
MTPYIQQQLKKLCDNPNWYDDMLWVYTYADKESLELDLMETLNQRDLTKGAEDQYDYFLDCWSGDDEYQYLYDYYENKYPEYNHQLKHYGK